MNCLNDELLERFLLEPTDEVRRHVQGCASCQGRVSEAEAQGRAFRAYVFPKTIDALLEAAAPKPSSPWRFWPIALAAVAAVLVAVAFIPRGPPDDYVGLKGDPLKLSVFTLGEGEQPVEVADGAHLKADAPLRFRLTPGSACSLLLISVDARGEVSRIYPTRGAAARIDAPTALPGGAVLDGAAGPERIFAVCDGDALTFDGVERAVKQLGSGEAAVRGARRLEGLPKGTRQATLLLEKER